MNCIELFAQQVQAKPKSLALWVPGQKQVSFSELLEMGVRAQSLFRSYHVGPGTSVLLLDGLSAQLYAAILALLSLGATVIFVEPWMPVAHIQKVIEISKPKLFISNLLGFLWGTQVKAIRSIPHWVKISSIHTSPLKGKLHLENLDPTTPGILTFTSGTTGSPKGVVRNQGYLIQQHEVLSRRMETAQLQGPDLCIFANFAISNLASGRGSILIPPSWNPKILKKLDQLPRSLRPESVVSGPAFLLKLMDHAQLPSLKSIHIGGALTDCWIFEKGVQHWPEAHWTHVYGGSEVEPVALADVRNAVQESRKQGYFQTLYLGKQVPEIQPKIENDGLWVAGPHVCPEYFGNVRENQLFKRKDHDGTLWHFMGDRVVEDKAGWWYQGRSGDSIEDFKLEQRIYQNLQTSKCFIRSSGSKRYLVGEGISSRRKTILQNFPELEDVLEAKIYRDRRHRARLDRNKTLQKGPKWLVG